VSAITAWAARHQSLIALLVVVSVGTLVLSALLLPWLIARLPADYFAREHVGPVFEKHHPAVRFALLTLKNVFGLVLVILGVLMLVLPGQGILTIIAGLAMLDIPGRHRFIQRLASSDAVLAGLNWLRRKAGREVFAPVPASPRK
jgi:hypothetical protein